MQVHFRSFFTAAFLLAAALIAIPGMLPPAHAAEDLYTVSGIHVDATAASSTEAFNAAIAQGRVKAFQILFRRLTRQQDWGRQPAMDTAALTRASRSFTVSNERRSTTRYVADVSYIFSPDAVARLLRAASIAYSQGQAKRILVIPMSPVPAHGPWAQALSAPSLQGSLVPYTVADAADLAQLQGLNFDTADWGDVAAAASSIHASEAALLQAVYADGHLTVNIRRVGLGETPAKSSIEVPMTGTLGTTYPVAAQAAVSALEDMWKSRSAIDYSQRGRLVADVRIPSLVQWGAIQSQLAAVPNVSSVTVVAMDIGYALLQIAYTGTPDQLRDALGGAGLSLTSRGTQWLLAAGPR
jgi:hypothetical protein